MKLATTALAFLLLAACGEKAAETPEAPAAAPAAAAAPAPASTEPSTPAGPLDPRLAAFPAPWNAGNLENGKAQFVKCRNCHSINEADGDMVGPNLHGVFARAPGARPKFKYSNALKSLTLEKWTPEEINKWITNPADYLPGSAMFLDGIKNPDNRRDIIAYLLTAS